MLILSTPPSLKMTLLRQKSLRSFVSCCITPPPKKKENAGQVNTPPPLQKKSPLNFEKWYIIFPFILHKCMIICYFNTVYFFSYKLIYIFLTIIILFTSWFFGSFLKFTVSSHSPNLWGFFFILFSIVFFVESILEVCAFKQAEFWDKTSYKTMR